MKQEKNSFLSSFVIRVNYMIEQVLSKRILQIKMRDFHKYPTLFLYTIFH